MSALIYCQRLIKLGSLSLGWTHDMVYDAREPYLERWIIWFGLTLRLHKFHKGDDDRAYHDHPWWFITFPFEPYLERTPQQPVTMVKALRPHFRSASHQHIVQLVEPRPVWTLILTGTKSNDWGFWNKGKFTPHEAWLSEREEVRAEQNHSQGR